MASIYDIRDKAQRAAGAAISGVQLEIQAPNAADPAAQEPARRTLPPFTSTDGRNYRAIYRAVCEYHERNNQPRSVEGFWKKTIADKYATADRFNDDPFVLALLEAVNDEIEREQGTL